MLQFWPSSVRLYAHIIFIIKTKCFCYHFTDTYEAARKNINAANPAFAAEVVVSTDIELRDARKAKKQKLAAATLACQSHEPIAGGSKDVVPIPPTEATSAESSEDEVFQDPVEYMPLFW